MVNSCHPEVFLPERRGGPAIHWVVWRLAVFEVRKLIHLLTNHCRNYHQTPFSFPFNTITGSQR